MVTNSRRKRAFALPIKTRPQAVAAVVLAVALFAVAEAQALTLQQQKGMYRHGIWEWSLRNCDGILRGNGYWFALKEVGEFDSAEQIVQLEESRSFLEGWKYMAANASRFGMERTCDYAREQWPAMLWREEP